MAAASGCGHLATVGMVNTNYEEFAKTLQQCHACEVRGANLWLCLYRDCQRVGCGDSAQDHSLTHYQKLPHHCVHLNISTFRVWCFACSVEVFLEPQTEEVRRPVPGAGGQQQHHHYRAEMRLRNNDLQLDEDSDDSPSTTDDNTKNIGLTGLQNIGNTCYMNAALQALSNTPPLTRHFIECGVPQIPGRRGNAALSRSYWRLVQEMWYHRRAGYVQPSGILYAIRNVHPMFRGYHQHDTQEFLRCFMDQLHEELKEPYVQPPLPHHTSQHINLSRLSSLDELSEEESTGMLEGEGGGASSQSEGEEYETCDSGVSERSSLSDEGSTKHMETNSRSPSPTQDMQMPTHNYHTSFHTSPVRGSNRRKAQTKYRSIISDVFDGKLSSSVQCLTCNRISTRMETFQDLSLPIPSKDHLTMLHQGSVNIAKCSELYSTDQGWLTWLWGWLCSFFWGPTVGLHDCLAAFFSADELKGDNMYSCEKCHLLRNGVKYSKLLELPEVLCIHLKRFRHELMFSSKINNYVTFPLEGLDLKPYLHKDCKSKVTTYNLISVICHHGAAGSGGHYTCYSLNERYNQWYEFDDQCVTSVRPDLVKNCEAYVLFYRKSSWEACEQREHVMQMTKLPPSIPSTESYAISKAWFMRFLTFAEPGPIYNTDLLCRHNQLIPGREQYADSMLTYLPADIWNYLYNLHGGGPTCAKSQLRQCVICLQESRRRPDSELREFTRCLQTQCPGQLYAVSTSWFSQWEAYVRGQTLDIPGPIDNSALTTNNHNLGLDKDYIHVTTEQWNLLHRIYEGGPDIVIHEPTPSPPTVPEDSPTVDWCAKDKLESDSSSERGQEVLKVNSAVAKGEKKRKKTRCMKIDRTPLQKLRRIVTRRQRGKYRLTKKRSKRKELWQAGAVLNKCHKTEETASLSLKHK